MGLQSEFAVTTQPLTSNDWYPNDASGTIQLAGTFLFLRPWEPPKGTSVKSLGLWLQTVGSVGAGCLLGLYDSDGAGQPGVLLAGVGAAIDMTTGAGAGKSAAITPTAIFRRCYLGCMVTGAPATMPVVGASAPVVPNVGLSSIIAGGLKGYTLTGVGTAVLPATAAGAVQDLTTGVAVVAQVA